MNAYVLYILGLVFVIFLLSGGILLITSPVFWLLVLFLIGLILLWGHYNKVIKGYDHIVSAYVSGVPFVSAENKSLLYVYPDKVTVNEKQIIPLLLAILITSDRPGITPTLAISSQTFLTGTGNSSVLVNPSAGYMHVYVFPCFILCIRSILGADFTFAQKNTIETNI